MLFSEGRSHPVMSTTSASTVGKVSRFVVDVSAERVVALEVAKASSGNTLHWEDVLGFGPDAVMVASEDAIGAARGRVAELSAKQFEVLGKRVLDDRGDEAGKVEDVDFDPASGQVTRLLTTTGEISGDRLIGCGSYALVVRAAQ